MVTEAGSYLRLIDFCITQLKAQGPSTTCNESKEEEEEEEEGRVAPHRTAPLGGGFRFVAFQPPLRKFVK